VKITKLRKVQNLKTKAFFDLEVNGITIKSIPLVEGSNGFFINCLSEKGKDGKYYDRLYIEKDTKAEILKMALDEYGSGASKQEPQEDKDLPF